MARGMLVVLFGLLVFGFLVIRLTKEEEPPPRQWVESPTAEAAPVGSDLEIMADDTRMCPLPNCGEGEQIGRIPAGTVLEVEGDHSVCLPIWDVTWYQVTYEGRTGWVSVFETDRPKPKERKHLKACP